MPTSARLATINRIQEIYSKLSKETLVSEELEELVKLTTELHESAVILRYKAAEERVFENVKTEIPEAKEEILEEIIPKTEPAVDEKPSEIDFSIFDQPSTEVEEVTEEVTETLDFTSSEEKSLEPANSVEPILPTDVNWSEYFEKVLQDHSTGIQTPLSALAGSFGLNERILYINELFDKEAEKFSEIIQKLDGVGDWNTCVSFLSTEAKTRNWDKENDTTGEFILHVKRRYA